MPGTPTRQSLPLSRQALRWPLCRTGRHAAVGLLLFALTAAAATATEAQELQTQQAEVESSDSQRSEAGLQAEIAALIEKLGHPSYAARLRARDELQRLGLVVFDALLDAQYHHPDSEVAMAARHLVNSLHVQWSTDTDPPAVREYLEGYGTQSELERRSRMDQLANLPDRAGIGPLCRLARFETSLRLSCEAALLVMRQPLPSESAQRRQLAQRVLEVLGPNDRQASQWLRQYALDLRSGSFDSDRWRQLIDQQRQSSADGGGPSSEPSIVLQLMRVTAVRAQQMDRPEVGMELAMSSLDLILPTPTALLDATAWALDHGFGPVVLELRQRQGDRFNSDPQLLYGAAEALADAGSSQAAEELSRQALQIDALPPHGSKEAEAMAAEQRNARAYHRREIGLRLEARGQFKWAEREFRHVINSLELTAIPAVLARTQLAFMLGELQRHQDVVDVLEPLVDRLQRDNLLQRQVESGGELGLDTLRSQLHYHRGLAKAAQGELPAARAELQQALQLGRGNPDILIAMYRLPGDEAWQRQVAAAIRSAASDFDMAIQEVERRIREQGQHQLEDVTLVQGLNNYAWLVANTFGDHQKALRYSLRSLEIQPDVAALLDTCARCYFAVGQTQKAVEMQRRAVHFEPHSPPMMRQLAEFEAAANAAPDQDAPAQDADDPSAARSQPADSTPSRTDESRP